LTAVTSAAAVSYDAVTVTADGTPRAFGRFWFQSCSSLRGKMASKERVLVVDDDRDARETLATALAQSGYLVQVAADVRDALGRLGSWPSDVIVSDVCLPGMSGVDLVKALRQRNLEQPVILITGLDRDLTTAACYYGAAACLRKPMSLEELIWAIDCALACRPDAARSPTVRHRASLRWAL
jgi:DNA-binding NtrC family response regulator